METFGAESLNEAIKADKTVVLDGIKSIAKSLGSTKVSEACLPAIKDHPGGVVSKVCHDTESIKGKSQFRIYYKCSKREFMTLLYNMTCNLSHDLYLLK